MVIEQQKNANLVLVVGTPTPPVYTKEEWKISSPVTIPRSWTNSLYGGGN